MKELPKKKYKLKEFEVKMLSDDAVLPKKAVGGSIGYDLCIPRDTVIPAHSRIAVPLDIAINLPYGIEGKIEPRSGFSMRGMKGYGTKTEIVGYTFGFIPRKKTISGILSFDADVISGKIDPNYTDNIHVIIKNNDVEFTLRAGTRLAQITFYQTTSPFFKVVDELSCNSRGGRLGHSGFNRIAPLRKDYNEINRRLKDGDKEAAILSTVVVSDFVESASTSELDKGKA